MKAVRLAVFQKKFQTMLSFNLKFKASFNFQITLVLKKSSNFTKTIPHNFIRKMFGWKFNPPWGKLHSWSPDQLCTPLQGKRPVRMEVDNPHSPIARDIWNQPWHPAWPPGQECRLCRWWLQVGWFPDRWSTSWRTGCRGRWWTWQSSCTKKSIFCKLMFCIAEQTDEKINKNELMYVGGTQLSASWYLL